MTELKKKFESEFYLWKQQRIDGTFETCNEEVWRWIEQEIESACKKQREICAKRAGIFADEYGTTKNFIENQIDIILESPSPKESV